MTGRLFTGWRQLLGVAALAALAGAWLPTTANAEVLTFRNDTKMALVVQGACIINGKVRRDQPVLVQPGASARVVLPGTKQITVFNAQPPNLPLFQDSLPGGNDDLYFSMQLDPVGKVRMDRIKMPMAP
jgi:hypothetical protein